MKMYLSARWQDRSDTIAVTNPFDGSLVDTVPRGSAQDVADAVDSLREGAAVMRRLTAFERSGILRRAAAIMKSRHEELARTISLEEGKILAEGRGEVGRSIETIECSADEAKQLYGETIPLDAAGHGAGKFGFTLRVPCGIVAAITPFNFPLNLVCHKVGPSIAAGNATLIKPASDTPLSALTLVEILLEAGLPENAIACITGPGSEIGNAICDSDAIRKISFTGSQEVGEAICRRAGLKRVTMELGSNSPVIVMDDADLELAARAIAAAGFANAGQVCISTQRVLTSDRVGGDFLDALRPLVEQLTVGDQLADGTRMGPMVREADAARVSAWIDEAVAAGAQKVVGGERRGALCPATILDRVDPQSKISRDELFGPAVAVTRFDNLDDAIRLANDSRYGLSAGIFTQDVNRALRFAREVDAGNLHINWSSQWRADLMPYGGLKDSGLGKEGPKYAIREMSEEKMVVMHLNEQKS